MIPARSFLIPTSKDFGQMVRGFRKRRGWTQAQLAQATGLLPKTISALESGTGNVLLGNAMRCLAAMEVDLYAAPREQRASKMRLKFDTSLLAPPVGSFAPADKLEVKVSAWAPVKASSKSGSNVGSSAPTRVTPHVPSDSPAKPAKRAKSGGAVKAQPKSPERAARILSDLAKAAKREKW